jgi:hypothetical protein
MKAILARSVCPSLLVALCALAARQSASSNPDSSAPKGATQAEIANEFTATAAVVAVDAATRMVTLRREDGRQFSVMAGEAVRNFDQIAVGDQLRVRYKESLAAKVVPGAEASKSVEAAVAAGRAKPGARPGAGVGVGVSLRVKIESIDLKKDIVTFALGSGELIAHRLQTPQGREFASGLAVGDVVQLDYAETLALSVEKL